MLGNNKIEVPSLSQLIDHTTPSSKGDHGLVHEYPKPTEAPTQSNPPAPTPKPAA